MTRPILAFLVALPLLAVSNRAVAQRTVTVHVPPGETVAFATKGRPTAPPKAPTVPKEGVATVPVEDGADRLYVWDRSINRVASASLKDGWSPRVGDLVDLAQVVVEVRHDGKPVAAANVSVDDGRHPQEILLDPSAGGDATFFDVKTGKLTVTVKYRAGGADAEPVTQVFTTKAEVGPTPHFTVSLPGETATVGAGAGTSAAPAAGAASAPAGPAANPSAPPPANSGGGAGGGFIGFLFALVIAGGVAAGFWYFLRKNPDAAGATLERLGAQIPKPGDAPLADPPVAAAPAPIAPEPPQKIVLDPAPATPAPAPISLDAPRVSVAEPSLVTDAGIPLPLIEGETVVGREVGLGLSLAGESTVSRRHARLIRSGGSVTLEDLGSTNGTFVNGARLSGSRPLAPGDSVQFGSVRFRYEG